MELLVLALVAYGLVSGSIQLCVLFGMVSYSAAMVRASLASIIPVTKMSGIYTCLPGSLPMGLIAREIANLLRCLPVYNSLKEYIRL